MPDLLVHLIRHGQGYNTHRDLATPYPENPPLTPIGRREAERLAGGIRRLEVDRLISSPMRRSVETALIVGEVTRHTVEVWPACYEFRPQIGYPAWGARDLRERYPSLALATDFG